MIRYCVTRTTSYAYALVPLLQPYVPGSPEEKIGVDSLAWWGGVDGREVIDEFVTQAVVRECGLDVAETSAI